MHFLLISTGLGTRLRNHLRTCASVDITSACNMNCLYWLPTSYIVDGHI